MVALIFFGVEEVTSVIFEGYDMIHMSLGLRRMPTVSRFLNEMHVLAHIAKSPKYTKV